MSKNLEGIVAEIRRVRSQKRPEIEKKKQRLDALLAAVQATRGKATAVAAHYPDLATAMQGISFNEAENKLLEAAKVCETALLRLRRDSINVGVAGKARQGKSQILQMLTGLTDRQIPTGDGGFCTAARSVVRNGAAQSATVFYLTEAELLRQKVWPSYEPVGTSDVALGLSPRPVSIAAFIQFPLPDVPDTASVEALENWEKVKALHADLKSDPALVFKLGGQPESVPLDSVRKYLVKDNNEKDYQVVDHVEIATPFEMDLPQGMTVYDLPGLEDPTPGIRETMLKSVSEDADIVLLLRMPKNTGDDWDIADLGVMNMLKGIYPADVIQPKDWIQLVLNLDRRPASNNEKNVERMKAKAPNGFSPIVIDCGSKDDVRRKVEENIEPLVNQAGRIDDLRIRDAESAFRTAIAEVGSLYNALRNAWGDIVAQESGFPFEKRLLTFMADLRGPFKKDMAPEFENAVAEIFRRHFREVKDEFARIYKEYESEDEFPPELPAFSKKRIAEEFDAGHGPEGVIEKAIRNQREAVLKLLRNHLSNCCDEMVEQYFRCVLKTGFDSNPSLARIGGTSGSNREWLEQFLATLRQSGTFVSLEDAVEGLLRFQLTFDGSVLPAIYSTEELGDFDPERIVPDDDRSNLEDLKQVVNKLHEANKRTATLYNWLKQQSEIVLSSVTAESPRKAFGQLVPHIATTMRANYDAFVFRFIWGDTVEEEWRRFVDRNKAIFWKEEFEKAAANSRLAQDWNAALSGLAQTL